MTTVNQHDDVVIDIKTKVKTMLDGAGPHVTGGCCIYRVPFNIRRHNEDAYTPNAVSIGPFHHGHPRLQNMQRHKLIYCKAFLERAEPGTNLDTLIHYIEEVEPNIRRCYSDTIKLNKDELVKLILVDSCFILELFWREWSSSGDKFFFKPWLKKDVWIDLVLLENQIPFFVLDNIFNLSFGSRSYSDIVNGEFPSFIKLTFHFFSYHDRSKLPFDNTSISHFTDLIRTIHYLKHPPETRSPLISGDTVEHLPSATQLREAGVTFKTFKKVNTTDTDSDSQDIRSRSDIQDIQEGEQERRLLDFKFSGGVLEIPQLLVEDSTETLFRNMVALEQCHYPGESYITYYLYIWDFLINNNRDVDLLVRKKVLVNWLGDTDSVANMFNSLMKNITIDECSEDYLRLSKELNAFCADPWRKKKATLRRDYCNTPWKTVATIAGILILVLTILQSVCSVLQVVQQ